MQWNTLHEVINVSHPKHICQTLSFKLQLFFHIRQGRHCQQYATNTLICWKKKRNHKTSVSAHCLFSLYLASTESHVLSSLTNRF